MVEVSDRFHLKPLLRALSFPHTAFVLALSQNGVRVLEIEPDLDPAPITVPGLPSDAASAAGSPRSRIAPRAVGSRARKAREDPPAPLRGRSTKRCDASSTGSKCLNHRDRTARQCTGRSTALAVFSETSIRGNPNALDTELASRLRTLLDDVYAAERANDPGTALRVTQQHAWADITNVARAKEPHTDWSTRRQLWGRRRDRPARLAERGQGARRRPSATTQATRPSRRSFATPLDGRSTPPLSASTRPERTASANVSSRSFTRGRDRLSNVSPRRVRGDRNRPQPAWARARVTPQMRPYSVAPSRPEGLDLGAALSSRGAQR